MELRQLRYFVAVAEELHFGRAADRLHISGPALSQQIIALEREIGVPLFIRDRRTVAITPAGRSLQEDARQLISLAESAVQRARRREGEPSPLRLGYVSWLPENLDGVIAPASPLRVDPWVLPSHAQADRVSDGSLDLALAWITATGAAERHLCPHLLRVEALDAVFPGTSSSKPLQAADVTVLIDSDDSTWSSWNVFAEQFAGATGASIAAITDGGISGQAFYAHVARLSKPVLASPKRHLGSAPPGLGRRPVAAPTPLWTWSLLHRIDDDRPELRKVVDSLIAFGVSRHWVTPPDQEWWLADDDPHREAIVPGPA